MAITEDLDLLEKTFRLLHIEWEKFFGGVEKKAPTELRTKMEALIRKYAYTEIRNNGDRFRYQGIVSRYNSFNELWNKRMRALEEGKPLGLVGLKAPPPVVPSSPAAEDTPAARAPAFQSAAGEFRVRNPERDAAAVRALYDRFLDARRGTGEAGSVKFESFQKLISQQAQRILSEKGAQAVDFRLETKDGKVSLKARPVK